MKRLLGSSHLYVFINPKLGPNDQKITYEAAQKEIATIASTKAFVRQTSTVNESISNACMRRLHQIYAKFNLI